MRGDLVMDGYWGRPEDTAAAIRDGWLHTGDIGVLDADGYLRITDRKKDMIVLSGGENVSPAKVEGMLMAEPEIAQAVVAGDGRAGLTALVVPAEGYDDVAVALAVNRVNQRLSVTERIRKHADGAAVHGGERPADADAEDPPHAGDPRQREGVGGAAFLIPVPSELARNKVSPSPCGRGSREGAPRNRLAATPSPVKQDPRPDPLPPTPSLKGRGDSRPGPRRYIPSRGIARPVASSQPNPASPCTAGQMRWP